MPQIKTLLVKLQFLITYFPWTEKVLWREYKRIFPSFLFQCFNSTKANCYWRHFANSFKIILSTRTFSVSSTKPIKNQLYWLSCDIYGWRILSLGLQNHQCKADTMLRKGKPFLTHLERNWFSMPSESKSTAPRVP